VSRNGLIHFTLFSMGKIVSVYEHFGRRTASRNELNSWTEVPLYCILGHRRTVALRLDTVISSLLVGRKNRHMPDERNKGTEINAVTNALLKKNVLTLKEGNLSRFLLRSSSSYRSDSMRQSQSVRDWFLGCISLSIQLMKSAKQ
jgi:hypothetical protein